MIARITSRRAAESTFKHAVLLFGAVLMAFPFYWMLTTSFKSFAEAGSFPPTLWPNEWHLENWPETWNTPHAPWARAFANTIFIAAVGVIGELVTATLAAYAFATMRFRGRELLFAVLLATLMIPGEATIIPNFVLMSRRFLNWYDTYTALIVPFLTSVFSIFLLRQFFLGIPRELRDAATIDGAGHLRFLWSVALPLVQPALITVALLNLLAAWNLFLWPLLVTASPDIRPVQNLMAQYQSEHGSKPQLVMAAASFVILPIIGAYLVAQKYFIESVARSGIRG